ncbi:MAG: outer membrane beta-barrel protein [Bacteroidota bacterium]
MKRIITLLLLIPVFYIANAQEDDQKDQIRTTPSPDFPGSLVFEYGLNYLTNNDHVMRTNPWQSATYNIYYFYPIKLGESRFAFNPGLGVGTEKFGFEEDISFQDVNKITELKTIPELPRFDTLTFSTVKETQLIANYIDMPLEFRIHSRKSDHKRSFYLSLGGKIGVNFDGKTKIRYSELGSHKVYKDNYHFNINSFRYGAVARVGVGPFNAWIHYSGSKLFRGNKYSGFQNPNVWSWGISLATF